MTEKKRRRRRGVKKTIKTCGVEDVEATLDKTVGREHSNIEKDIVVTDKIIEPKEIKTTKDVFNLPEYNYKGVERVNTIPDFTKLTKKQVLVNTMGKYIHYEIGQLEEELQKDKSLTVLEGQIITLMVDSMKADTTTGSANMKYVHDRLFGKVTDKVEHTGPDGGAIQLEHGRIDNEIESFLETLTPEELDEYEKLNNQKLEFQKRVASRKANE